MTPSRRSASISPRMACCEARPRAVKTRTGGSWQTRPFGKCSPLIVVCLIAPVFAVLAIFAGAAEAFATGVALAPAPDFAPTPNLTAAESNAQHGPAPLVVGPEVSPRLDPIGVPESIPRPHAR